MKVAVLFKGFPICSYDLLLSQRERYVTVKFFDTQISMIFDISELPESWDGSSALCRTLRNLPGFGCGGKGVSGGLEYNDKTLFAKIEKYYFY